MGFFRSDVGFSFWGQFQVVYLGKKRREVTFKVRMAVQHSTLPIAVIKPHSITKKLDQDPMRVPRKVVFIIVLTDTICNNQKPNSSVP